MHIHFVDVFVHCSCPERGHGKDI